MSVFGPVSSLVVWGDDSFGQTNVPPGLSNVVAIAAGDFNTFALLSSGKIVSWGDDSYGQTNVPANLTNAIGVAAGNYDGLALVPSAAAVGTILANLSPAGLILNWAGGGTLQWAPSVTGPFTDLPMTGNSFTNRDFTTPAKFFRLRQ